MEKGPSPRIHGSSPIGTIASVPGYFEIEAEIEAEFRKKVLEFFGDDVALLNGVAVQGHGKAQVPAATVEDKSASGSGADSSVITASGIGLNGNWKPLPEVKAFWDAKPAVPIYPFGCPEPRSEEEMLNYRLGFQSLPHGKAQVEEIVVGLEGDTSLITGSGISVIENRKPPVIVRNDNHTIAISAAQQDSPQDRIPNKKKHKVGGVAILCTAASAQTLLTLVGGSGAMRLPESIYYCTSAANAIAFGASSLALLLVKKKPRAASILETVGFASAIATFILMMRAVIQ